MNLAGFDLNLLLVFQAVMAERHVTRAGQRIGLSQPAVSAALNRLRAIFRDDLFVRVGREMMPTPRALTLAQPVADALQRVEHALAGNAPFDPATTRREFIVRVGDYVSYLMMAPLMSTLMDTAPGIVVRCVDALTMSVSQPLEDGRIDFAIEVMSQLEDPIRSQLLLQDQFVVVVARQHPEIHPAEGLCSQQAFDLDLYCQLPHVLHSFGMGTTGNVDAALAAVDRQRHVGSTLPHFFSIARAVAGSKMIATVPERLAVEIAPVMGLRIYQVPVALPPISLAIIWHRRNDHNPGYSWFRHKIMSAARSSCQMVGHDLTARFQPSATPVVSAERLSYS